jgi:hypothetical protein
MLPSDLLYQPSSFIRIREQVRDAQERMDRHRQLLDRYLPEGDDVGDPASRILRRMADMERRDPVYVSLRMPMSTRQAAFISTSGAGLAQRLFDNYLLFLSLFCFC